MHLHPMCYLKPPCKRLDVRPRSTTPLSVKPHIPLLVISYKFRSSRASSVTLGMVADESPKRKHALKVCVEMYLHNFLIIYLFRFDRFNLRFVIDSQILAKTAGVLSTAAFTTAGLPPAAIAARKAKEVVEVVEAVDNTKKILAAGAGVLAAGAALLKLTSTGEAQQDFLEASPYWDQSNVPLNVYKNKAPFTGKVVSTKRIVGPQATGETCHIIIDHKGDFPVRLLLFHNLSITLLYHRNLVN